MVTWRSVVQYTREYQKVSLFYMLLEKKNRSSQKVKAFSEIAWFIVNKSWLRLLKHLRRCRMTMRLIDCKAGRRQASGNSVWVTGPGVWRAQWAALGTQERMGLRLYNSSCGISGHPSHTTSLWRETDSFLCGWGRGGGGSWGGTAGNIPGNSEA